MDITVAIDCMGGDHGPHVTVRAAVKFQRRYPDAYIVLVGLRELVEPELRAAHTEISPRLRIHHASEVVTMDEPPALALRGKKRKSFKTFVLARKRANKKTRSMFKKGYVYHRGMKLRIVGWSKTGRVLARTFIPQ